MRKRFRLVCTCGHSRSSHVESPFERLDKGRCRFCVCMVFVVASPQQANGKEAQ